MTKIYCLQDNIGFVELVNKDIDDHALSVVNAARCSYGNEKQEFDEKDKKLTKYLWNNEHTSPFRHSYFRFHLKVPLFTARQIFKYQVGSNWRKYEVDGHPVSFEVFDIFSDTDKGCSWNELSGRYKELQPQFYIPHKLRANLPHGSKQASSELDWDEEKHEGYRNTLRLKFEEDYRFYQAMLKDGVAKELARITLPQSIYTEIYWSISLQACIHFLNQRTSSDSQHEIRQVAFAVYQLIKPTLDKLGITFESLVK